jgi:hypothetical protein
MLRDHKPSTDLGATDLGATDLGATDLGANYFDRLATARLQRRYVQRLEHLGYTVTRTPLPAA